MSLIDMFDQQSTVFVKSMDFARNPGSSPHCVTLSQFLCFSVSPTVKWEAHVKCLQECLCVATPQERYELPSKL